MSKKKSTEKTLEETLTPVAEVEETETETSEFNVEAYNFFSETFEKAFHAALDGLPDQSVGFELFQAAAHLTAMVAHTVGLGRGDMIDLTLEALEEIEANCTAHQAEEEDEEYVCDDCAKENLN